MVGTRARAWAAAWRGSGASLLALLSLLLWVSCGGRATSSDPLRPGAHEAPGGFTARAGGGAAGTAAGGSAGRTQGGGGNGASGGNVFHCFAAGTRIATPDGPTPIDQLRVGDHVYGYDLQAGAVVISSVTATMLHPDAQVGELTLASGAVLLSTPEHPIYSESQGDFAPAERIADSSTLLALQSAGEGPLTRPLAVERVSTQGYRLSASRARETVYNISVAGVQNYFAEGVLVHNKPPPKVPPAVCLPRAPQLSTEDIARKLSQLLWGTTDSEAVAEVALAGNALFSAHERTALATRMLGDARARAASRSWAALWFGELGEPTVGVDASGGAGAEAGQGGSSIPPELYEEERARWVEHVVFDADGRIQTLFTAPYGLLNERLASHYGATWAGPGEQWAISEFGAQERSGILTQGWLLTLASTPAARGALVSERLACQPVPAEPSEVLQPEPDPARSPREALELVTAHAACRACHQVINPLTFALQHFDAEGRYRTTIGGFPIDTSGSFRDVPFSGPRELGAILAQPPEAMRCLLQRTIEGVLAAPSANIVEYLVDVSSQTVPSEPKLTDMLLAVVASDALLME